LHKIIGFARRTQGLLVAKGNPLNLQSLQDVATQQAQFANRALGTGTRVVLQDLMLQAGLKDEDICGFTHTEPSHTAVAHAIAAGHADAGLGIAAAAAQAGLDFVPLADEHYHLVCLKSALLQPGIQSLLKLLQTTQWQDKVSTICGYTPQHSGHVLSMRKVLPWWDYRKTKPSGISPLPAAYTDQSAA
jgi:molybdate-binding protein